MRLATVLIALSSIAPVQAKDDPKKTFERGRELYFKGDYPAALPYLKQAYELSNKRPSTIRALANCERALGMRTEALEHLREYLATKPTDAVEIEAQIAELETPQKLEPVMVPEPREEEDFVWDSTRKDTPPPQAERVAPVEPIAEPSLIERPVFWVVVAGVVAAAGTAVALSIALSGTQELYGGSEDRVLRR